MADYTPPTSVAQAVEMIQEALVGINEDLPKVEKGIAKAGRRVRKYFQLIVKTSKAARQLVTDQVKKGD